MHFTYLNLSTRLPDLISLFLSMAFPLGCMNTLIKKQTNPPQNKKTSPNTNKQKENQNRKYMPPTNPIKVHLQYDYISF